MVGKTNRTGFANTAEDLMQKGMKCSEVLIDKSASIMDFRSMRVEIITKNYMLIVPPGRSRKIRDYASTTSLSMKLS